MDANGIIKGIVEQAIATTEKVHPGAIPIDDLARNAARLAFVAGMREAAKMADSRAAPQNSGLAKGYNYAMRSIAAAIRAKIGGAS